MLDEIKTIQFQFPSIKLNEILEWATINGARALNLDSVFGSFEKGKKPGIVLINNINNLQITDSSSAIRIL
jgi:cytosine/adenosine deaminase-related metal-dependent hydrolase